MKSIFDDVIKKLLMSTKTFLYMMVYAILKIHDSSFIKSEIKGGRAVFLLPLTKQRGPKITPTVELFIIRTADIIKLFKFQGIN